MVELALTPNAKVSEGEQADTRKEEANATPVAFRDELLRLARMARGHVLGMEVCLGS